MGRKKRNLDFVKPFCYFCEKTFNNEITLHQHQKAKHFTCPTCHKKFPTTSNLVTHMSRTHTNSISKIPNAIEGRDSAELNIFGMTGVPRQVIQERMIVGAAQYWTKIQRQKEAKLIKEGKAPSLKIKPIEEEKPKKEKKKRSIRDFVNLNN